MIQKKYVIDCVTSKFVLERNCTEKTKRSGEVVGEKEKKGGPKCTRGTSYLRRKLTQLSHNANNTSLVSISHTSRSPLNNAIKKRTPLNNIFFGIRVFTHIPLYLQISFSPILYFHGLSPLPSTVYSFWPTPTFFWAEPTSSHSLQSVKKSEKKKTKKCRKQDLNLQLSSRDEGGLPLHHQQFCDCYLDVIVFVKYGRDKTEKYVATRIRNHNFPYEVRASNTTNLALMTLHLPFVVLLLHVK